MWDRLLDKLPRRSPSPRRVQSTVSRRETQRRMALALIGFLTVLVVLGVGISVFPRGQEDEVEQLSQGERAFREAQAGGQRGLSLIAGDPVRAQESCSDGWGALLRAEEGGVPEETLAPVRQEITRCLDALYSVYHPRAQLVFDTSDMEPRAMVQGPDRNAYIIDNDSRSVWRIETRNGQGEPVIREGDGPSRAPVGVPRLLATGGADLVVLDNAGNLWRWRRQGVDIALLRKPNEPVLGDDALAMEAFITNADQNLYNLYIVDPSEVQIIRYQPQLGGSGFSDAGPWLQGDPEDVSGFRDMVIDRNLYTLSSDGIVRHFQGRAYDDFRLAIPPDDEDMRPGHDYRFMTAFDGKYYIYDAKWNRVVVFQQGSGQYLEQWSTRGSVPPMEDLRGMYLVAGNREDSPPTLFWLSPRGLYQSQLVDDPDGGLIATPAPEVEETPAPERTPRRPRRTPAP